MNRSVIRSAAAFRHAALACLAVLAWAGALFGQERPAAEPDSLGLFHAPPIVVTANRDSTPAARVASTVTVIGREEIERRQLRTVLDALRGVPGMAIARNGGPGGVTSAFLRGAGADQALVLIDGVAVNDAGSPTNAYDLAHLLTADVERIEVLRGPQSTLYGSSAMGGVIQVFTRAAGGTPRGAVALEGGSFATAEVAASAAGGAGRLAYSFTAASRRTDGISAAPADLGNRERDGHRATTGSARLTWRPGGRWELGAAVRGVDASGGIDQGTPTGDDPNYDSDVVDVSGSGWLGWTSAGGRWRQTLSVAYARQEREARDEPDAEHPADRSLTASEGSRRTVQWVHEANVLGRLVAGAGVEEESASSDFTSDGAFGPFASSFPERDARTVSAFLHHESAWGPLVIGVGGRIDDHDRFGTHGTFRVTPVVSLGSSSRVKATWGTGFKAPTLFQLYDPDFGNPDLEPETSRGWDAGVEQDLAGGRARLGATVFATDFESLVGFEFPDGYRNVSEARARGVEVAASLLAVDAFRIRGGYTYTKATDESAGSPDEGLPLLRRPRHQANVGVELAPPGRWAMAADVLVTGERDDRDFAEFPAARVTLDGYVVARAAGSYRLTDSVRIEARVENAFDASYREVFGFGTPGRSVFAGLHAAF